MIKNDNSENNDEEKVLGCLDGTSPEETEDDVCDKNNENSENNDKEN